MPTVNTLNISKGYNIVYLLASILLSIYFAFKSQLGNNFTVHKYLTTYLEIFSWRDIDRSRKPFIILITLFCPECPGAGVFCIAKFLLVPRHIRKIMGIINVFILPIRNTPNQIA